MFCSTSMKCFNLMNDLVYICNYSTYLHNRTTALRIIKPFVHLHNNSKIFHYQVKQYSKEAKTPKPTVTAKLSTEVNLKKKSLQGGVAISEITIGRGTPVKSGKVVTVYYSGRLKATNELFDSMTSGSGLTFRLGRGEVIDGWDIGLVGMKVGGKRIVTCPPSMAYGAKGCPPKIPPNSTLVFEVELKNIK